MFGNNFNNPYGYNSSPYSYTPTVYPSYTQPNQSIPNTVASAHVTNTNKIFVNGVDDVRTRNIPPNSDYMFLDNDKPLLYQKVVDSKGQFDVKIYDIVPHKEEKEASKTIDLSQYVLKTDFDKLTAELTTLKEQLIKLGGTKNESIEQQ